MRILTILSMAALIAASPLWAQDDANTEESVTETETEVVVSAPEYDAEAVKENCAALSNGDFEKQALCMETAQDGYTAYAALYTDDIPAGLIDMFKECENAKGLDWFGVASCAKSSVKTYSGLQTVFDGVDPEIAQAIQNQCQGKAGNDQGELFQCMKDNMKRYNDYVSASAGVDQDALDTIAKTCNQKWPTDWGMMMYCSSEQIKAWKQING